MENIKEHLSAGIMIAIAVFVGVVLAGFVGSASPKAVGGGVDFNDFQTATLSQVNVGPGNAVTVLATSSGRTYAAFSNGSSSPIYLCFSGTATCNNYSGILVAASSTFEITPLNMYTGLVTARSLSSTTIFVTSKN